MIAEFLPMTEALRVAVLARGDDTALAAAARSSGFDTLRQAAEGAVARGITNREEVERVLGRS